MLDFTEVYHSVQIFYSRSKCDLKWRRWPLDAAIAVKEHYPALALCCDLIVDLVDCLEGESYHVSLITSKLDDCGAGAK